MPSFAPGNRSRTASAMTCAVECRIASSSSWAPASSSSSAEPRSGAARSSSSPGPSARPSGSGSGCAPIAVFATCTASGESKRPLVPTGREVDGSISRGSTRLHDSCRRSGAHRALQAALTGGPGPVHRPLTGGANSEVDRRASSRGPALWLIWPPIACPDRSVELDYTAPTLDVDDAEEEQQDDDQPGHAEDPEQKRDHSLPPFGRQRCGLAGDSDGGRETGRVSSGSRKRRARITARLGQVTVNL